MNVQKWEYKIGWAFSSIRYSEGDLNEAGELGWELVGIYCDDGSNYAVFKRPKE